MNSSLIKVIAKRHKTQKGTKKIFELLELFVLLRLALGAFLRFFVA
jgi:hypothetical protein